MQRTRGIDNKGEVDLRAAVWLLDEDLGSRITLLTILTAIKKRIHDMEYCGEASTRGVSSRRRK